MPSSRRRSSSQKWILPCFHTLYATTCGGRRLRPRKSCAASASPPPCVKFSTQYFGFTRVMQVQHRHRRHPGQRRSRSAGVGYSAGLTRPLLPLELGGAVLYRQLAAQDDELADDRQASRKSSRAPSCPLPRFVCARHLPALRFCNNLSCCACTPNHPSHPAVNCLLPQLQ